MGGNTRFAKSKTALWSGLPIEKLPAALDALKCCVNSSQACMENYSSLLQKLFIFQTNSSSVGILIIKYSLEDAHKVLETRSGKGFLGHPVYTSVMIVHCSADLNSLSTVLLCHVKGKQDLSVQSKNSVEKGCHLQILHVLFTSVAIKTWRFCIFFLTEIITSNFSLKSHWN